MRKVVFLDRDGVINNEESNYYIFRKEDFFLNRGIVQALKTLKAKGFSFIVISNQGGISKGLYRQEDTEALHKILMDEFSRNGIELLEIYYCPHHPDTGKCLCRKPGTVSLEKAITRFAIDSGSSWFVGDRESDIEAGKKMGLKTILVKANQDMTDLGNLID
jgi:D-glycero-D-manno-heptose 1,7-bisphosphate phosphatase